MLIIIEIIHRIIQLLILLVIVQAILTYFMDPYHPVRRFMDRLVNPMLAPIRRLIPSVGMFDFSPVILIVFLQIVDVIIRNLLLSLT